MRITTVIDKKEIIYLNKNDLIFIRGRVFKKVNISRRLPCVSCCFYEITPDSNEYYCNMTVIIGSSIESTVNLCYSKVTDGYDLMNISFKEMKMSLFVARLIWKSTRKSE